MLTYAQSNPMAVNAQVLIQKIQELPPERMSEVDDFVEFLRLRMEQATARALTLRATQASEASFAAVWDNADDEAYDAL